MTLENKVKKLTSALGLTLALATYTCGGTESKSDDDDNNKSDWPACELKNYVDTCENFTGTYEVNATNCSAKYSEIQIEQFADCKTSNSEAICNNIKGCEVVVIGKNIKDGSMECILPIDWAVLGNLLRAKEHGNLIKCNEDTIKFVNITGDCTYWLSKTLGQPKLFHDVDYKCSWTEGYIPLK